MLYNVTIEDHTNLNIIADKINNPKEILEAISEHMLNSVQTNFQQEGRPERWVDRKDPNGDWPILFKSGDLYDSLFATVNDDSATITYDVDYGGYLQGGTDFMPPRPFLMFQEPKDLDAITELLYRYLGD